MVQDMLLAAEAVRAAELAHQVLVLKLQHCLVKVWSAKKYSEYLYLQINFPFLSLNFFMLRKSNCYKTTSLLQQ